MSYNFMLKNPNYPFKALDVDTTLQHRVDIGGSASGLADWGGGPFF